LNERGFRRDDFTGGKGDDMRMIKQLRSFWILCVTTIVLACASTAFAQPSYRITDMGLNHSTDNFSMVMGLNNEGWAENMDGVVNPPIKSTSTTIASGRAVINAHGRNIDLGTLGGKNSWTNYGGINDRGEAVGLAETSVPDPDGEDMCAFGTKLTCRPFLWREGHMMALPTLGGNNGQASAINNRGQIVGISETKVQDSGCPANKPGKIISPAFWEKGEVRPLPTVDGDPDGFVQGINDQGQAVGSSGNCSNIATHAVLWENDTASQLPDLGLDGNDAYAINDHGLAVGYVSTGTTIVASLWPNGTHSAVKNLGILPGDGAAFATGINNRGQVVGSTFNSQGWSRGFIWQDNVMTDLNTLISKDSKLSIIAASNINERGQISGMATVMSGPDEGKIHAILLTPVDER
jgi:probable HAF family extracellular repeat protein